MELIQRPTFFSGFRRALFCVALYFFSANFLSAAITGYGVFKGYSTTAPSNTNNFFQTNPYAVKWTIDRFDGAYFAHDKNSFSDEITIKTAGSYRISMQIPLYEVSGSNRRSVRAEIFVNGSPLDIGRSESAYIRDSSDHTESSLHLDTVLAGLSVDDVIEVRVSAQTNQTGEVYTSGANLFLQYIDPSEKILLLTGDQTSSGADLNNASEVNLLWDARPLTSGAYSHSTVTNSNEITINEAGSYRVSLNIPLQDPSACPGNNRTSVQARIKVNGSIARSGRASQGYIRCLDDHKFSTVHWFGFLDSLSPGDVVRVDLIGETTVTGATINVPSGRKASLAFQKVEDTSKSISLYGNALTSGTNWNPTSSGSVRWSNQVIKDASVFGHSTSTNNHQITFNEDGDYLIVYSDVLTSTSQRANPLIQFRVNGSLPDGAKCATHYMRNQNGHSESSCASSFLLDSISSGDVLEVGVSAEANGGTVNDLDSASIHIFQISNDAPILDIDSIPNKAIHYDTSDFNNLLDSSGRNGGDASFGGSVNTLIDISGADQIHNGIQTNGARQPSYNPTTKALTFDGVDDTFDIINASDINLGTTTERTFAMVFRTGSDVSSRQMIYEEGGTARGINVYIDGGLIYLGFWNKNNDGDGAQPFTSTNTAIVANTNYYITMVLDYSNYSGPSGPDGALRGTINGSPFSFSSTTTSRLFAHAGDIGLAAKNNATCYHDTCPGGDGDYFGGEIFEFIMYNSAISPALETEYYNYFVEKWPDPFPVTNLAIDSNYTALTTNSQLISWDPSITVDVADYEIAVGTTVGAEDELAYTSVGNVTSTTLTSLSLAECTSYFASIKAIDDEAKRSTVETTEFFKFDGTDPSDPSALVLSGTASASVSRTLSWSASTDNCAFQEYEVALGTTSGGNEVVDWTSVGVTLSHSFTGLSLSGATDYFLSVRGVDSAGNKSGEVSSVAWQLDTCVASDVIDPTDPSALVVSGQGSSTSSPNLSWGASTEACGLSHYEISIGSSAGAKDIYPATNIGDVTTFKVFGISPSIATNTNYFFNLKAIDLAGNESAEISSASWQLPAPGGVSTGLVMWLDALDSQTLYSSTDCSTTAATTDNASVACWRDKSTQGNNASAAAAGNRPSLQLNEFNANPILRFASNDYLDFTNISDIRTVFIVNKSSATTYQQVLGHTTSTDWFTNDATLLGASASSALRSGNWRFNRSDITDPQLYTQNGQYSLYSIESNANVEANHLASDRKTNNRNFVGDVAEVIIYDRVLTNTEKTNLENYLYDKWFSVAPSELTNLSQSDTYTSVSTESPSLTWDHSSAPDFSFYEVALGTAEGLNDLAGWFSNGSSNSYQFLGTSVSECVETFMSVRAVDSDGNRGPSASSLAYRFDETAPSPPNSLSLSGTASTSTSQTLLWGSSIDGCFLQRYEVSISTTPGGDDIVPFTNVGVTNSHSFSGLSLSAGVDYFLNVKGVDGAGNKSTIASSSPWQVASCVATDTTDPIAPASISVSGTPEVNQSPLATWGNGSDACSLSHYEVGIGTNTSTPNVVGYTNVGLNLSNTFTSISPNLAFDQDHFFLVRSVDKAGNTSAPTPSSAWQLRGPASVDASGLAIWVDLAKASSRYQNSACSVAATSNNDFIACLKDLSGNDNDLTVSANSNKATFKTTGFNGLPAAYFDGATNEFLNFDTTLNNIRTIFWVIKEDSSNLGSLAMLLGDPEGSSFDFHRAATGGAIFSAANAAAQVRNGDLKINKSSVVGTSTNMPSTESVLSLVTTGNATAGAFSRDRTSCCGERTFGGYLSELIIYDRALSAAEVIQVEDYLMTKWGLVATATSWTGTNSTDWGDAGNWDNGIPTATLDCVIPDRANDPIINSGNKFCKSLEITTGNLTFSNGSAATLTVFQDATNDSGTLTGNDGTLILADDGTSTIDQIINLNGGDISLGFSKTAGGNITLNDSISADGFTMLSGQNFEFIVPNGIELTVPNGLTIAGGVFNLEGGATLSVGSAQTVNVSGGQFKTTGTNDTFDQELTNKARIRATSGDWNFTSSSGVVSLTGFLLEDLSSNGLYIGGTTDLAAFDGGQFINLNLDFSTPVKGLHLDTSSTISESSANNIGFMWGAANGTFSGTPATGANYYTVYAPNCGGGTIIFDQWFGDFYDPVNKLPATEDKILDNEDGANSCAISMTISASPVTITTMDATGYNEEVLLTWETGSELNHLGFNVYRSTDPIAGFEQINGELIRNYLTSGEFRGRYRFEDKNLTNDTTYYYMIEDIATNGDTEFHGPVFATPAATAGSIPSADPDQNIPPGDGGDLDLGNGVALLSQTKSNLRLSINPAALGLVDAGWNASYLVPSIPGYSNFGNEDEPQVLFRKILIPIEGSYNNIASSVYSQTISDESANLAGKELQPAPRYIADGSGVLQPQYVPSVAAYSANRDYPSSWYEVNPLSITLLGKTYVEVKVYPIKYNPSSDSLNKIDQLVLDIGLNGSVWNISPPVQDDFTTPATVEGALRLRYKKSGMYQVNFDDLKTQNIEGPFDGVSTESLRGYYHGEEVGLIINSADSTFSDGDSIVFYAKFTENLHDTFDEVVISPFDLRLDDTVSEEARRIDLYSGEGSSAQSRREFLETEYKIDSDNYAVFDSPIGAGGDHLFHKRLFREGGAAVGASGSYTVNFPVNAVDPSALDFKVILTLSGRGVAESNPNHSLKLSINGVEAERRSFRTEGIETLEFTIPTNFLVQGSNSLTLEVLGDLIGAGDFEILDFNEISVKYDSTLVRSSPQQEIKAASAYSLLNVKGFTTSSIRVFDVSDNFNVFEYNYFFMDTFDSGASYELSILSIPGSATNGGEKLLAIENEDFLSVDEMVLVEGEEFALKSNLDGARLLIIARPELLAAAYRLKDHKEANGLTTMVVSLEQVYAEFSHSRKSDTVINDLIKYSQTYWTEKPNFVFIMGDASYDPRNNLEYADDVENPIYLVKGDQVDFGSDSSLGVLNLGDEEESLYPSVSIGRLPTNSLSRAEGYVSKVIDYESGNSSPDLLAKKAQFYAGRDKINEGFAAQSEKLAETFISTNTEFSVGYENLGAMAAASATAEVESSFNDAPLIISFFGHGAEDQWGIDGFFTNDEAIALSNNKYPIVVGMNCLNGYYYDADPTWTSLSEELVLNPNGGAIAFWGSTAMTAPGVQVSLATNALNEFGQRSNTGESDTRLGEVLLSAKSALVDHPSSFDTVRSWTIIGDPSLKFPEESFSEAQGAPETTQVNQPSDEGKNEVGVFGCSVLADGGTGLPFGHGLLLFLLEVMSYIALARFGRKLLK
jgi:hypothetical protein